ncbi:MAG: GDYXXLXY domain-containing protein [Aureispira sp.]|nr:GDYXXLXY domain-containing protein [Aureispira sp.]
MTGIKRIVFLVNLAIFMVAINYMIIQKERTISNGTLVLMKLAPVDPRSLMQGDYMDLRYDITRSVYGDSLSSRGYCVVTLDANNVAQFVRFQDHKTPLSEGEVIIKYFSPYWDVRIGAESFFFEEGTAKVYEQAQYGGLRVDGSGNSLLVSLHGENYKELKP